MFGSVLLRREGVRGFGDALDVSWLGMESEGSGFGIGCSGVILMTQDGHRQVRIGQIGVGMVTVVTVKSEGYRERWLGVGLLDARGLGCQGMGS